jgi:hypothetical protein
MRKGINARAWFYSQSFISSAVDESRKGQSVSNGNSQIDASTRSASTTQVNSLKCGNTDVPAGPYVPGEFSLAAHRDPYPEREWCPVCGWRKGGKDSWDGSSCKCGFKR